MSSKQLERVETQFGADGEMLPASRESSFQRSETDYSQSDWSDDGSDHTSATAGIDKEEKLKKQKEAEAQVKAVGGGKSITFGGGVAFLINNVTGGGMVLFPLVFQQAGWLVVIIALISITLLATMCGFMIIESMAMMPGNKRFEKRAEYTSIAKHYLPHKLYVVSLFFFHASLLANGISSQSIRHANQTLPPPIPSLILLLIIVFVCLLLPSFFCFVVIIQSCQVMDFTMAELFGRTCAVPQFSPNFGFSCPDPISGASTVFGDEMKLIPLGWFVTMLVVIPLGMVNLDDNMSVSDTLIHTWAEHRDLDWPLSTLKRVYALMWH
jgi:ABC-type Na+ efflux pump permease subunit